MNFYLFGCHLIFVREVRVYTEGRVGRSAKDLIFRLSGQFWSSSDKARQSLRHHLPWELLGHGWENLLSVVCRHVFRQPVGPHTKHVSPNLIFFVTISD
jgi:hypothetical protein